MSDGQGVGPLGRLPILRDCVSRRSSSWDRSGGNRDRVELRPGGTATLLDVRGVGCIRHIWITVGPHDPRLLRRCTLRAWWDGEDSPSVEAPLGDFFAVGFGASRTLVSLPLQRSPDGGRSLSCYFPMPFASAARLELHAETETDPTLVYFYVDYEEYPVLGPEWGRFHAQWRRAALPGIDDSGMSNLEFQMEGINLTGRDNYVALDARGRGHYVGCVLNVENRRQTEEWNWFGEGDDMLFVDDEPFPPSLHGTGQEDYFNLAWCPAELYNAPYHGVSLAGEPNWAGRWSFYRFHLEDPVYFQRSLRVTFEHGHANRRWDDYSSVAFWYQSEPHSPFSTIPPAGRALAQRARLTRDHERGVCCVGRLPVAGETACEGGCTRWHGAG
jgi:hypothetical protein